MRIPTAEFFAIFAATGPLSSLQNAESFFQALDDPCDPGREYKVVTGDTCNSIAAAKGAPTCQIICQNPDINAQCNNLQAGWELCLGHKSNDCKDTYPVVSGDTCYSIAEKFGIPLSTFMDNNRYEGCGPNKNCTNIYAGEVLCVAKEPIGPAGSWKCDKP